MDMRTEARLSCRSAARAMATDREAFWEDLCLVGQWVCWAIAAIGWTVCVW